MMIGKGANKRFSAILFISSIVSSLSPSVVGPPERNFKNGQPEIHQAMDNMIIREKFMKRSPSFEHNGTPFLSNPTATLLLQEAERILPETKDKKQKEWMEELILKLKGLASGVEQNDVKQSSDEFNSSSLQVAQPPSNSTVPEKNSLQLSPIESLLRAVPEPTPEPQQSSQMTSELSVTIPDIIQVEYDTQQQSRQKENPEDGDELVRELKSLHETTPVAPETSSKELERETYSPLNKDEEVEKEKAAIKEKLANEVKELKSLGETDQEILDALHIDGFKPVDSKERQKETENNQINKFEETPERSEKHMSLKRVLGEGNTKVLKDPNQNIWSLQDQQAAESPRQIYLNNTLLGMHINLPPMNPRVIRRQFYGMHRNSANINSPSHHGGLKDTIQKLQAENHQKFLLRNHGLAVPNTLQQERFMHFGPVNARTYGGPQSVNRYPLDNPALYRYPNADIRPMYMPYPLNQNSEQKIELLNKSKSEITYSTDPLSTELSEEMKRQLRDGKIILLSDSVVRSNFTADSDEINGKLKCNNK